VLPSFKWTIILLTGCAVPTVAQRTSENVVTQSGDAFGRSVGNERVGLYNGEDVRGFNPIDAGNARIEGLYFDQQDRPPNRITDGNTVRVGITAQRTAFPAPTGIIDYALTFAGDTAEASVEIERGPLGGVAGAAEVKIPITATLGIAGGVGGRRQFKPEGGINNFRSFGAVLKWQPNADTRVIGFYSGYVNRNDEARATVFPTNNKRPPKIPRGQFLGQSWADKGWTNRTNGMIVQLPLGPFQVDAGVFQSSRDNDGSFSDLLIGIEPNGDVLRRDVIADRNNQDRSTSGEVRLSQSFGQGMLRHKLMVNVRGRVKDRSFGGSQRIALGPSSAVRPDVRPLPPIALGPDDQDKVRQFTLGAAYSANWAGRGTLDLALSRAVYRKSIDFSNPGFANIKIRDNPLLWSANASVIITPRLALYGGFVTGLEETAIAPEIATNRSEAPPATRTQQNDLGLRYALTPKMTLVAGVFSVRKPYFNLDALNRFRDLGQVDNRGVEVSLSGQVRPGLTLVSGLVLLDPVIKGEAVDTGRIGARPVGSVRRRAIANIDWRPNAGKSAVSFDLGLEALSQRTANAANSFTAPARETVNLGTRYRFNMNGAKFLLRGQVTNLFNDYGWNVSSSGGFTFTQSRTYVIQLLADL
jgi:iron complex outermembrane recepter protein